MDYNSLNNLNDSDWSSLSRTRKPISTAKRSMSFLLKVTEQR